MSSTGWEHPPSQGGMPQQGQGWSAAPPPPQHGAYAPPAQPMPAYQPNAMPGHAGDMHYRGGGGGGGGGGGDMLPLPLSPKSIARVGFGAYGDKFLGAGQAFVTTNYAKYFGGTAMRYYFDVNEPYVFNKLRLVACPFLHKGSWARIPEQVAGGLTFKPPRSDINAPDLYIPLMGFWTYVLAASTLQVRRGDFTPEGVALHAWWGGCAWGAEILFVWMALRSLSTAQMHVSAPIMDVGAYTGYMWVLIAFGVALKCVAPGWAHFVAVAWGALASAVFMVKTLKRIIFSEARHHGLDGNRHNYALLVLAALQFPLHVWLGSV